MKIIDHLTEDGVIDDWGLFPKFLIVSKKPNSFSVLKIISKGKNLLQ